MAKPRTNLWEKLPEESAKAFEAFARYRDLGSARSLAKAAASLGKNKSLLEAWSSKFGWTTRVEAFDLSQDRASRLERRRAVVTMARRHAEMAIAIQAKIIARLKTLQPDELTFGDLLRGFAQAVKIEREARRIPMKDAVQDYQAVVKQNEREALALAADESAPSE